MGASRRASGRHACGASPTSRLVRCRLRGTPGTARPIAQSDPKNTQAHHRMSDSLKQLESALARELGRVIVGAETSIRALVIALVARGHVLVQGVPGLG